MDVSLWQTSSSLTTWTIFVEGSGKFSQWIIPTRTCIHESLPLCCLTQIWYAVDMTAIVSDSGRPTHLCLEGRCRQDVRTSVFRSGTSA